MTELSKEYLKKIIDSANEVITALADENPDLCKENTDGMIRAWDYLNDDVATPEVVRNMAHQLLAGMEQEPLYQVRYGEHWRDLDKVQYDDHVKLGAEGLRVLYTAPSAPVVPETLPCPVMLEPGLRFGKGVRTQTMLDALQRRAEYSAELEAMTPEQRADHDAGMKAFAAMLQGAEPVKSRCAIHPAPALDSLPKNFESRCSNFQAFPGCSCRTCRPVTMGDMRFVICPVCGNKRCPHANDHRNACTGSNEPGQDGSAYPVAPQQESKAE